MGYGWCSSGRRPDSDRPAATTPATQRRVAEPPRCECGCESGVRRGAEIRSAHASRREASAAPRRGRCAGCLTRGRHDGAACPGWREVGGGGRHEPIWSGTCAHRACVGTLHRTGGHRPGSLRILRGARCNDGCVGQSRGRACWRTVCRAVGCCGGRAIACCAGERLVHRAEPHRVRRDAAGGVRGELVRCVRPGQARWGAG